jgi:hypothetical protein
VVSKLNAAMPEPEKRQFDFDPVAMVRENRTQMVIDCLTILLAYEHAGRPFKGKVPDVGSFEGDWTFIREALAWLGEPDPAITMDNVKKTDPVIDTLRKVMDAWSECYGDKPTTLQRAVDTAKLGADNYNAERTLPHLKHLAEAFGEALKGKDIGNVGLGIWFSKQYQRIVGERSFRQVGNKNESVIKLYGPIPDDGKDHGVEYMSEAERTARDAAHFEKTNGPGM